MYESEGSSAVTHLLILLVALRQFPTLDPPNITLHLPLHLRIIDEDDSTSQSHRVRREVGAGVSNGRFGSSSVLLESRGNANEALDVVGEASANDGFAVVGLDGVEDLWWRGERDQHGCTTRSDKRAHAPPP